jgi:hypothetical protein
MVSVFAMSQGQGARHLIATTGDQVYDEDYQIDFSVNGNGEEPFMFAAMQT